MHRLWIFLTACHAELALYCLSRLNCENWGEVVRIRVLKNADPDQTFREDGDPDMYLKYN